jgi:predicted nucleic acid-binding protein
LQRGSRPGPHPASSQRPSPQAEIFYGIELLSASARRSSLAVAASDLFAVDFAGRVLSFDQAAARVYTEIAAIRRRAGRPISQFDAQIAAIAGSRDAVIATRDVASFAGCGIDVINPWQG